MGLVSKAADEERWDKLKSWANVQEDITHRLQVPEKYDQSMTLYRGPQLYHTLLHPSNIKCMTHFKSSVGEVFATHFRVGTLDQLCVWNLGSRDRDAACTQKRFDINSEIKVLIYIPKHRVYMGFCSDLQIRMYTDAKSKCQEISAIKCQTTMLSLAYNKETDEVYVGGIGALEKWNITGSEHSAVAKPGKTFQTDLQKHEWVIDIKVDEKNQQMMALSYEGIYAINCETMKQTHHLQNRHEGSLKCCCFYKEREYFITGGGDGQVKVWNAVVFTQVHIFYGHHNAITGLQVHHVDPLLFSCSLDGSVQIWRMDNFSKFMRVDLGETIHQMKLIGDEEFYCQTEKELRIYSLNQFYNLFAPVESTVYKLQLCPSNRRLGKASRVIASTEDGSVRIFSPLTGLAITIIYPMASFQVLSCFAYNREKEKLQTLLENGDVLSFNCTSNPCRAEEVWRPATPDEAVTQLALMSLQYKNRKKQTEYDTVVLGGLKNGQVSLLDASKCEMVKNVQAHEGLITCMEICTQIDDSGFQLDDTSQILITGGNDQTIRLWKVEIIPGRTSNVVKLHQKLKVKCSYIPSQISMYENTLCVAYENNISKGFLQMYRIDGLLDDGEENVHYTELSHIADENHVKEVTSIDKCPLLGLFASSSTDGYIKIWNRHNQLIREMMFDEPVYGMCFANCRGDILIGFQSHVCSIPLTSYLTQEYLERIVLHHFQDDVREIPIPYNNKLQPWFDPKQLPKFSTSLNKRELERSAQDTEEDYLAVLEDLESLKSPVPSKKKIKLDLESVVQEKDEHLSEEKIKEMAMEILSDQILFEDDDLKLHSERSVILKEVTNMLRVEVSRSLGDHRVKLDGKTPPNLNQLTPWERELLKRKPIIPLDGFIPNSVVRKYLGYVKPVSPHSLRTKKDGGRWKVKPVPRVDPKHMPAGWIPENIEEENEDEFDNTRKIILDYADTESENGSTDSISSSSTIVDDENTQNKKPKRPKHKRRCDTDLDSELDDSKSEEVTVTLQDDNEEVAQSMVGSQMSLLKPGDNVKTTEPLSWNFIDEADRSSTVPTPWRKMGMMMRATSNLSTTSSKGEKKPRSSSKRSTPSTPTSRYELKSKKFEFNKFDFDMGGPDRLKSGGRETSRERSKSFRLTNMVVDEDSTDIRFKEGEKSGKRRLFPTVDLDVVHQLLDDNWFPDLQGSLSFDSIMSHLMNLLDDTDNQEQHEKVCDYILAIHKEIGIPDVYLDRIVSKISNQLGHSKKNIKHDGLRTLKVLGGDRQDVLAVILPKLIDSQAEIRSEAADILASLVGVRDKNDLLRLMESMGISSKYDSKADEEEALKALAMRLDIPYRTDTFNDWIGNWVDDLSSPGLHDVDDLKLADIENTWDGREKRKKFPESLYISESNSRASNRLRELSFISDKSGASSVVSLGIVSDGSFVSEELGFNNNKTQQRRISKTNKSNKAKSHQRPKIQIQVFPDSDDDCSEQNRERYIGNLLNEYSDLRSDKVISEQNSDISDGCSDLKIKSLTVKKSKKRETTNGEMFNVPNIQFEFESVKSSDNDSVLSDNQSMLSDFNPYKLTKSRKMTDRSRQQSEIYSEEETYSKNKETKLMSEELRIGSDSRDDDFYSVRDNDGTEYENDLFKKTNKMSAAKNEMGSFWSPGTQESGRRQKSFHLEERQRESISTASRESSKYRRNSITKVEISGKNSTMSDEYDDFPDGFDPRNPMMYQYYSKRNGKLKPKSGKILKGGVVNEEGEEEFFDHSPSKGTDFMEISSIASSQEFPETLSSQFGDGMSTHDSGIGRDMSELSSSRRESGMIIPESSSQYSGKHVNQVKIRKRPSKQDWIPRHQLSPVKSTGALSEISPSPVLQKTVAADWQKFFETPTALERKRLDRVRKEYSKGKLKPVEKPTIRYIADGLPTLPGEAGMRLLHTIKVGDKSHLVDTEGRHRIQSIPGKLMVHTKDENSGMSKFGILQMKWTTGVPCSMTKDYDDFSSKSGTCTPTTVVSALTARSSGSKLDGSKLPNLQRVKKVSHSKVKQTRSVDSVLPSIDSSGPYSPDFEWEHPMPPPPGKDSRTNVAYIKKQHDYYCKYYNLAKKNMQRDISKRECGLPDIVVKHALNKSMPSPTLQKSLSKLSRTHSIIFPPITLAQLINT